MIRPIGFCLLLVPAALVLSSAQAQTLRSPAENAFDVCTNAVNQALRHGPGVEKLLFSAEGNTAPTEGGTVEVDGPGTLMMRDGSSRALQWRCSYRVQDASIAALAHRVERGAWQDLGTRGPAAAIGGGSPHDAAPTRLASNRCRSAVMAELFRNNPSAVLFEVDVGTQVGAAEGTRYPVHGRARIRQNAGNEQTQTWQCSFDARDGNPHGVQLK